MQEILQEAATTETKFNHREWHIASDKDKPGCFSLKTAMYRDIMTGGKAEKTMMFAMVTEVLNRLT